MGAMALTGAVLGRCFFFPPIYRVSQEPIPCPTNKYAKWEVTDRPARGDWGSPATSRGLIASPNMVVAFSYRIGQKALQWADMIFYYSTVTHICGNPKCSRGTCPHTKIASLHGDSIVSQVTCAAQRYSPVQGSSAQPGTNSWQPPMLANHYAHGKISYQRRLAVL